MTRKTVLDLFCGAGGLSSGFARAGFEVSGVDLVPAAVQVFRENGIGTAHTINLHHRTVNGGYDVVLSILSFVIGCVALAVTLGTYGTHNTDAAYVGAGLAVISVILDLISLRSVSGRTGPIGDLNFLTLGLDTVSGVVAFYDVQHVK